MLGKTVAAPASGPGQAHHEKAARAIRSGDFNGARNILLEEAARLVNGEAVRRVAVHLNELAVAYCGADRLEDAAGVLQRALDLAPDYVLGHDNLAAILMGLGRLDAALAHFDRANALDGPTAERLFQQSRIFRDQHRVDDVRHCLDAALRLAPNDAGLLAASLEARLAVADWERLEADTARLAVLARHDHGKTSHPVRPFVTLCLALDDADRLAIARDWAAQFVAPPLPSRPARSDSPLRIGYLSDHFRRHATAWLMQSLFAAHDRARVRVHAYSIGPDDGSPERRKIAADCDRFTDLRPLSDADAAATIASDDVDVLVDLMGYTANARHGILARRPAPLQVAYLVHPGTTGADWLDYIVADSTVLPPEIRRWYSEKVLTLPRCYQVNDPNQKLDEDCARRSDWDLPEDAVVFACFNIANKIEPTVFGLWMDILKAVPGSVLWLLADYEATRQNLRDAATRREVDPERLIFARRVARPRHLRRQQCADLFLDTLICNAHTTASDALFAGLPLLTSPGRSFAARVAASLLTALGIEELIVPDIDAYRATAIALANDPGRLAGIRGRITDAVRNGPLFDVDGFAGDLERGFALIHANRLAGQPPHHIAVPAEG